MAQFTLSDLESITGIKADTIRIWEKRYRIFSPGRTATNRRIYLDEHLAKLINISLLYNHNIKISKIAAMSDSEIRDRASALSDMVKPPDSLIGLMLIAMNSLDEAKVNDIILKSFLSIGFESTFKEVIFPFLHKVGVMWHTGSINPATEHFVSGIFRRRLISAIDALPPSENSNALKFLVFLPEGEWHELALLFYTYKVLNMGHKVLYLGQSTPFDSVIQAAGDWDPDILLTGIHTEFGNTKPGLYLKELSDAMDGKKILVAGVLTEFASRMKISNIIPVGSDIELTEIINRIRQI